MFRILERQDLTPVIHLWKVEAPRIAKKAQAGQFVIVHHGVEGERIPLTIADWDREAGTVTVVFMEVGASTQKFARLSAGDAVDDLVGPLGRPTEVERYGTVACVAGGFAIATIVPIAREMKAAGNRVISVMGFRTRDLVFWEERLGQFSDELIVTTDDGTYGRKGLVTEPLKQLLETRTVDRIVAIGPTIMMKFSALTSQPFGVKTIVSLNPIMVDGTGMCGACRVEVAGETRLACVDGPDFDGHLVDWDLLISRQRAYLDEERASVELLQHRCHGGGRCG